MGNEKGVKKSFKNFAKKHLAKKIEQRRKSRKGRVEQKERHERRDKRKAREAKKEETDHQADLKDLKDADPEFYSYLEQDDPTLLEYGNVDEDDDVVGSDEGSDAPTEADDDDEARALGDDDDDGPSEPDDAIPEGFDMGEDDDADAEPEGASDGVSADGEAAAEEGAKHRRIRQQEMDQVLKGRNAVKAVDFLEAAVRQLGFPVKGAGGDVQAAREDALRKFEDPNLVKSTILSMCNKLSTVVPALVIVTNAAGETADGEGKPLSKKAKKEAARAAKNAEKLAKKKAKKGGAEAAATTGPQVNFRDGKCKWLAQRFLNVVLVLLQPHAGITATDAALSARVAQSVVPYLRVLHLLRGMTKPLLRALLALCAHSEVRTRVAAYMAVESLAKRAAGTRTLYQSAVFKGLFLQLIKSTHKYTIHSAPIVGFLMNAVKDLYGTDLECAYQHVYVYTRQLAVYLRSALQSQTAHNIRAVFNWQFVNALRTWGLVVSSYPAANQLGPLLHPVIQIATGLLDLFASPRMFPMHLHVLEMLNHISQRAGVYTPVSNYLLRLLTSPSLSLEGKSLHTGNVKLAAKKGPGGGKFRGKGGDDEEGGEGSGEYTPLDLQFALRVKKVHAKAGLYRANVWEQGLYLLAQHLAAHSHSIGYPEAFWAVTSTLTKLRREVKLPKVHSLLTVLLRQHEATAQQIAQRREQVSFGPCDTDQVNAFEADQKHRGAPIATYYAEQRKQRLGEFAAKQKSVRQRTTLEAAVAEAEGEGKSGAAGGKKKAGKRARPQ